jgi:hypothetical protein
VQVVLFAREPAFGDFSLPDFQIRVYSRSFAAKWFLVVALLHCVSVVGFDFWLWLRYVVPSVVASGLAVLS